MAAAGHLEGVLDELDHSGKNGTVSVRDVVDAFEDTSAGALIAVFGLIAMMPLVGDIPGMSIFIGSIVLLILAQILFRPSNGIWLPGFIAHREVEEETLDKGVERARPYVRWVDKFIRPRITALTQGRVPRTALTVGAAVMAVALMPMELVPFGATAPAFGIVCFGLALIARDGVFALLGYAMVVTTLIIGYLAVF